MPGGVGNVTDRRPPTPAASFVWPATFWESRRAVVWSLSPDGGEPTRDGRSGSEGRSHSDGAIQKCAAKVVQTCDWKASFAVASTCTAEYNETFAVETKMKSSEGTIGVTNVTGALQMTKSPMI